MDPITLNNYYKRFARGAIDLDEQENRFRTDYQSALDTLRRNRRRDVQSLGSGMADRGLTHSGIAMNEGLTLAGDYDQRQGAISNQQSSRLSGIARKRLEGEADINEVRAYGRP